MWLHCEKNELVRVVCMQIHYTSSVQCHSTLESGIVFLFVIVSPSALSTGKYVCTFVNLKFSGSLLSFPKKYTFFSVDCWIAGKHNKENFRCAGEMLWRIYEKSLYHKPYEFIVILCLLALHCRFFFSSFVESL